MNRFRDNYGHSELYKTADAILDLVQPEVETFDPPTRKPVHRAKREVNRMTGFRDMAIRKFLR